MSLRHSLIVNRWERHHGPPPVVLPPVAATELLPHLHLLHARVLRTRHLRSHVCGQVRAEDAATSPREEVDADGEGVSAVHVEEEAELQQSSTHHKYAHEQQHRSAYLAGLEEGRRGVGVLRGRRRELARHHSSEETRTHAIHFQEDVRA